MLTMQADDILGRALCGMSKSLGLILKAEMRLVSWGSNKIKFPFQRTATGHTWANKVDSQTCQEVLIAGVAKVMKA